MESPYRQTCEQNVCQQSHALWVFFGLHIAHLSGADTVIPMQERTRWTRLRRCVCRCLIILPLVHPPPECHPLIPDLKYSRCILRPRNCNRAIAKGKGSSMVEPVEKRRTVVAKRAERIVQRGKSLRSPLTGSTSRSWALTRWFKRCE